MDHASDCAVHNAPALPVGPCDCGARIAELEAFKQLVERAHAAWMDDKVSAAVALGEVGRALIEIEGK